MLQSLNFAPSTDLAPFVRQHFVFRAPLPADFELIDRLLSETAMIRVLLGGDWSAEFEPGVWRSEGPVILFGANSRYFRVRVRGPFTVVGVSIRPSGWSGLFGQKAHAFTDRMCPLSDAWGSVADDLHTQIRGAGDDDAAVVAAIERVLRVRRDTLGNGTVNAGMAAFEEIARHDSTMRVADAATSLGLSGRALERHCCATFGLTPKAILRRSRFIEMATLLRGYSDPNDEERAALRFSDQSHLNREFRHFIGLTPGMFEREATPLLDAVLKLRADGIS